MKINAKYNFFDWLYSGKTLPIDINKEVEDAVALFKNDQLNKLIKTCREKWLFGDVYLYLVGMSEPIVRINFQYGICLRYVLISEDGMSYAELKKQLKEIKEIIIFSRSIYNRKISKFKPKEEKHETF